MIEPSDEISPVEYGKIFAALSLFFTVLKKNHRPFDSNEVQGIRLATIDLVLQTGPNPQYKPPSQILRPSSEAPDCSVTLDVLWPLACGTPFAMPDDRNVGGGGHLDYGGEELPEWHQLSSVGASKEKSKRRSKSPV
jgi:hypothetical protein